MARKKQYIFFYFLRHQYIVRKADLKRFNIFHAALEMVNYYANFKGHFDLNNRVRRKKGWQRQR
jgi:hypothetical protein